MPAVSLAKTAEVSQAWPARISGIFEGLGTSRSLDPLVQHLQNSVDLVLEQLALERRLRQEAEAKYLSLKMQVEAGMVGEESKLSVSIDASPAADPADFAAPQAELLPRTLRLASV